MAPVGQDQANELAANATSDAIDSVSDGSF
jgi:hypothetical protein